MDHTFRPDSSPACFEPGQLSRYSDSLWVGRSGIHILAEQGIFSPNTVQPETVAHPASYSRGAGVRSSE
jgi:hypothetical protein